LSCAFKIYVVIFIFGVELFWRKHFQIYNTGPWKTSAKIFTVFPPSHFGIGSTSAHPLSFPAKNVPCLHFLGFPAKKMILYFFSFSRQKWFFIFSHLFPAENVSCFISSSLNREFAIWKPRLYIHIPLSSFQFRLLFIRVLYFSLHSVESNYVLSQQNAGLRGDWSWAGREIESHQSIG
jgi:hypothetical protein